MSTRSNAGLRRRRAGRPDAEYSLIAGLYVATFLTPAAVVLLSTLTSSAAAQYVGLLVVVVAIAVGAGWVVSRIPGTRSISVGTT
jgi:hypothetical protein